MAKKTWSDNELDLLAMALHAKYPQRALPQAAQPHQVSISDLEFNEILQSTLPRERHGLRPKFHQLRRQLLPALARLGARPALPGPLPSTPETAPPEPAAPVPAEAPATAAAPAATRPAAGDGHRHNIRWTDDEWRFYALALHTMYPQLDMLNATDTKRLTLQHMNSAAQMMEPDRQRSFRWIVGPAQRLLRVYADARARRDPLYYGRPADAAAPEDLPEPQAEPQAEATADTPHKPRYEHHRVIWSKAEWVQIATRLDQLHPLARYPERGTTGALTAGDISMAQSVLPEDRRRNLKTTPIKQLRGPLLEAFKEVRRLKTDAINAKLDEARGAHQERLERRQAVPDVNPWEAACKPLVALLVRELSAQLLPALVQALQAQLAPQGHAAPALPAAPLALAPEPRPEPKSESRLRVGVVSGRSTYADELRRTFPDVEFTFIEAHNTRMVDSVKNCDKVIMLTKFTSHSMCDRIRKVVGERYVPVNGSVTDMKRVISGWLAGDAQAA